MSQSSAELIVAANEALIVRGAFESIREYFVEDYLVHLTDDDLHGGHKLVQRVVGALREAFSDISVRVDILLDAEERVAWQRTLSATHSGSYAGFPATGRSIVWRDMVVTQFREGRIAEEWHVTDLAEQLLRARKR